MYTVLIQPGVSYLLNQNPDLGAVGDPISSSPTETLKGAAPGFLVRGVLSSPEPLVTLLGNKIQTGYKQGTNTSYKTYFRNEALRLQLDIGH
jgi:hypothetical protein